MIIGISGLLGSGKTLLMTIIGKSSHDRGREIYSNYYTKFSKMIDPYELLKFELNNCTLLLDEIQTLFDSRISSSEINRLSSYFFLQTRKRNVNLIYTSQLLGAVDLRLRFITDFNILAERLTSGFRYTIYVSSLYYPAKTIFLPYEKAKKFFDLYDTSQIIYPFAINPNIDFDFILDIYKKSTSKKTFITLVRNEIPSLKKEAIESCFEFLENGNIELAKKCLKID